MNLQNILAGSLFVLLGGFFLFGGMQYSFGSAFRMGPGYFPVVLGGVLLLLGAAIAVNGALNRGEGEGIGVVPWRGLLLVIGAPVGFALLIQPLGFLPTVALTALLGTLAAHDVRPLDVLISVGVMTGLSYFVFKFALGLPMPLFGVWLT